MLFIYLDDFFYCVFHFLIKTNIVVWSYNRSNLNKIIKNKAESNSSCFSISLNSSRVAYLSQVIPYVNGTTLLLFPLIVIIIIELIYKR